MRFKIYILLVLLLFSCQPKLKPDKPEGLISQDIMVEVLADMFVISSAKGMSRGKFEKAGINPEQYILEKYSIDSTQFANSNNYYAHDIKTYKSLIERVKSKLTSEKEYYSKMEKQEKEQKRRQRDSLRKVKDSIIKSGKIPSKIRVKEFN